MSKHKSIVFETPFFKIEKTSRHQKKSLNPFYRLIAPHSVICCVLNKRGNFLMVRQYRPAMNVYTLEFPAGEIHKNETPIQAVKREVLEELGIHSIFLPLGNYSLMMNRTNIKNFLFLGLESEKPVRRKAEPGIKRLEIPKFKFQRMVINGEYLQLAGLGILQIIRLKYGVDLFRDPLKKVHSLFL